MDSRRSSFERNREAWNRLAEAGNEWTRPVSPETIAAARQGDWSVFLTPSKPVPREWFGDLRGKSVLGLASGGGQQCPIFAAAGAEVTSFDAFNRGELVFSSRRLPTVVETEDTVEFSHTFEALIGGQLAAGLALVGFYEDEWAKWKALYGVAPSTFATRAIRLP